MIESMPFEKTLLHLKIDACILKESDGDGWVTEEKMSAEEVFGYLNKFILRFDYLETLELIGMSIVDHLQDMLLAFRRPKLKVLALPYNGIE